MNNLTYIIMVIGGLLFFGEPLGQLYRKKEVIKEFFKCVIDYLLLFRKQHSFVMYVLPFLIFLLPILISRLIANDVWIIVSIVCMFILYYPSSLKILQDLIIGILFFFCYIKDFLRVALSIVVVLPCEIVILFFISMGISIFLVEKMNVTDFMPNHFLFPLIIIMLIYFMFMLFLSFIANFIRYYYFYNEWVYQIRKLVLSFVVTIIFATFFGINDIIKEYVVELVYYFEFNLFFENIESYFSLSVIDIYTFFVYIFFGSVLCFQMTNDISKHLISKLDIDNEIIGEIAE